MNRSLAPAAIAVFVLITGCGESEQPQQAEDVAEHMQLVPGATFRMGSSHADIQKSREATGLRTVQPLLAEVPARDVTVGDFLIDVYDVTNRDYADFVSANPEWREGALDDSEHNGRYLEHWTSGAPPENLLDHPVTFITWQSAVAYCNWRGKRLPSEAEYEWEAQDGATGAAWRATR